MMGKRTSYQLREAAGGFWLINTEQSGLPFEQPLLLNACGAMIWKEYAAGKTRAEIAVRLQRVYGLDADEAAADVGEFLEQLNGQGIE